MPEVSPTPMFNATGVPVDPSVLIPGGALKPPISPPTAPDYLTASVRPGETQQVPITTGYDVPSRVQAAAAQMKVPSPAAPPAAPPAAAQPAPPTTNLPTVNAPPPPPPGTTAQPAADPLGQVLNHINGPESGAYPNPYMTMYGGQQINEQTPSRPGYFGFPVTPPMYGPDGRPTSATGKAQWEADTWRDAATQYQAAGNPAPDFRKPADQDAVQRFWVSKLYKERTGRDAVADAAAGKFDYSQLTDQWPTLGGNQYPGHQYVESIRNRYGALSDRLNTQLAKLVDQLNAGDADLGEAMKRIRAAQDRADQAQDAAMKAIARAPEKPDIDGVKHISALGTIVGLLGGLFTKAPALASINAAASAIEAYNAGDLRNYNIAYKNWETQTNLLFKVADMNASRVRSIMEEEKLPIEERRAKVQTLFQALGLSQVAEEMKIKGDQVALDWSQKMYESNQRFKEYMAQLDATKAYREQTLSSQGVDVKDANGKVVGRYNFATKQITPYPEGLTPATKAEDDGLQPYQRAEVKIRDEADPNWADEKQRAHIHYKNVQTVLNEAPVSSPYGPLTTIKVTDEKGETVFEGQAWPTKDGRGYLDMHMQPVPAGKVEVQDKKAAGAGRQAETQLIAMRGAANEAVADLTNLVEMPITANLGSFMGVQYQTPDSLAEALRRDVARKLTPQEVNDIGITFSGVGRSLAILEGQGRASGLVGLSGQMEKLAPQSGDTPLSIMRRYAQIRQIIERSVENAKASGHASPEAMKLFDKIAEEAKAAVPWTVHDVNQIAYGDQRSVHTVATQILANRENFRKVQTQTRPPPSEAVDQLRKNPTPENRKHFDEIFGEGAADQAVPQQGAQ